MKDQFRILSELRKVEEKAFRLQTELERIPREIAKIDSSLAKHREAYLSAKTQFEEAEKKQRRAESDLKEKDEGLKKAESKMMEVKTNQEYQAALKENESQKGDKSKFEESVLSFITQAETLKKAFVEAESQFKTLEAAANKERAEFETEGSKLKVHYEELVQKKNAMRADLKSEIRIIYDRLSTRLKDQVIAIADAGLCQACNMRVAPQMYNEMLGHKAFHRCGNCGRILITKGPDDLTAAAQ